jgi:homoserine O-succinyltransferase/O-acetyltransferase
MQPNVISMPDREMRAADTAQITVALVNNMPDAAFVDTEGQFRRALARYGAPIELELYAMAGIVRSEAIAAEIRSRYRALDELWASSPDALIVTGTEPVQTQLPFEPYWPYLARLLEWAADSVPTTLLSCLAAHASVLMFDGIERVPRAVKCSGVFQGPVSRDHPLADGLPEHVPVPHSRVNDIPEDALVEAGYEILIGSGSGDPGWSVASRRQGDTLFVLCQGHPEYGTESLLKEYRRDVRRSLFGRGAVPYPSSPTGYFGPAGRALLEQFSQRASAPDIDAEQLFASFPYGELAAGLENTWSEPAAKLYTNWLGSSARERA